MYTSVLVCDNISVDPVTGTQNTTHSLFSDFQCWSGIHIIHATFALLASLTILAITFLVTVTYFQT
jgi:hypothetical protein